MMMMYISEPQFVFDIAEISEEDKFVQIRHESMDGFLKT